MPTYRGVTIELHSQFDIETFPEYQPRQQSYYDKRGIAEKVPPLMDEETSTCNVYVPVFAGSQFWISYIVEPPVPDDQYFVFKLFIDGSQIVNWSCGKKEQWKGKTMFGLFQQQDGSDGKRRIEKRVFRFTSTDRADTVADAFGPDAYMEIRVHRARGRKRIAREVEPYESTSHGKTASGIDLVDAGRAGSDHPKKFYKYALIDPVDIPYIIFRYHYRTWEQLQYLGLFGEAESDTSASSTLDVSMPNPQKRAGNSGVLRGGELGDDFVDVSLSDDEEPKTRAHDPSSQEPNASTHAFGNARSEQDHDDNHSKPSKRHYRLSIPPSLKLTPPRSGRPLPPIPQKNDATRLPSYTAYPVYPFEEWEARTPSPVRSIRDGISTPPLGRRRGLTATSLINVVASAWKRRGTPSSEYSNDTGSRSGSRARDVS